MTRFSLKFCLAALSLVGCATAAELRTAPSPAAPASIFMTVEGEAHLLDALGETVATAGIDFVGRRSVYDAGSQRVFVVAERGVFSVGLYPFGATEATDLPVSLAAGRWSAGEGERIEVHPQQCRATVSATGRTIDFSLLGLDRCPQNSEGGSPSGRFAAFSHPVHAGVDSPRILTVVDLEGGHIPLLDTELGPEDEVDWSTKFDAFIASGKLTVLAPTPTTVSLNPTAVWLQ